MPVHSLKTLMGSAMFVICMAGAISSAGAESRERPPLTLDEAIRMALQQHPRLAQSRQRTLAAQAQTGQARSALLPQIHAVMNGTSGSARSNTSFTSGAIIQNPNSNQATAGFLVDQLIYDFGRTFYQIKSKTFLAESREYELQADRALTILTVERAYYNALKQFQLVKIGEQAERERKIIRDLIETLYQREKRSKIDVSLAEVEFKNAQLDRLQAENDYQVSLYALRKAVGLDGVGEYSLEEPMRPETELPSLDQLTVEALERRPELEAVRRQVKGSAAAVISAKRQYLPSVNATVSSGESAISDSNGKWWYGAFGSISVPLFTGGRIENQIREAEAKHREQEERFREMAQEVELQLAGAFYPYQVLREKIAVAKEQVATARLALDLARERLRLGLGSVVEVTQSEVASTRAEIGLVTARFDAQATRAAVEYAAGRNLAAYPDEE